MKTPEKEIEADGVSERRNDRDRRKDSDRD